MTEYTDQDYASYRKKVWIIYSIAVVVFIAFLVFVVAQDNEEKAFYTLMTAVASYVLRPTKKFIDKMVLKFFNVEIPAEPEPEPESESGSGDDAP